MSIASELADLSANKAAIKAAIVAKNPEIAPTDALAQWPSAIDSIPSDGSLYLCALPFTPNEGGIYNCTLLVDGSDYSYNRRPAIVRKNSPFVVSLSGPTINNPTAMFIKSDGSTINLENGDSFTVDEPVMLIYAHAACLLGGTLVTLADGTQKNIEDVGYDDSLLVWDFDNGEYASARPIWIKMAERTDYKFSVRLASGAVLEMTGEHGHRAFNIDQSKFEYLPRSVGDRVWTLDGIDTVVSCEKTPADCDYYNVVTSGHLNLFANGILTSCRLNNCRNFDAKRMRWFGNARQYHTCDEFAAIQTGWIEGLRLLEQPIATGDILKYIGNMAATMQPSVN